MYEDDPDGYLPHPSGQGMLRDGACPYFFVPGILVALECGQAALFLGLKLGDAANKVPSQARLPL